MLPIHARSVLCHGASAAQHNMPTNIHTNADVETFASGDRIMPCHATNAKPKQLRIGSSEVFNTPTFDKAHLHALGRPSTLFAASHEENKLRLLQIMTEKDQADEIAMARGHFIPELLGWVPIENRTVSFRWDQNGEVIAELGSGDENEIPIERETAYAWVCKNAQGEDMYTANSPATAPPPAAPKEEDMDVELEWPRWVDRKTHSAPVADVADDLEAASPCEIRRNAWFERTFVMLFILGCIANFGMGAYTAYCEWVIGKIVGYMTIAISVEAFLIWEVSRLAGPFFVDEEGSMGEKC